MRAEKNAAKAVRGSVSVRVQLDADTEHLAEAKVVKRIGIGCGLRPLTLEELLSLGLPPPPEPKTIERIVKQLPEPTVCPSSHRCFPAWTNSSISTFDGNDVSRFRQSDTIEPWRGARQRRRHQQGARRFRRVAPGCSE
ncbi:MAG: hypothetical protein QM784_30770 [Polyangiaceae bacterium]